MATLQLHYPLGSFLHRVPWMKGTSFCQGSFLALRNLALLKGTTFTVFDDFHVFRAPVRKKSQACFRGEIPMCWAFELQLSWKLINSRFCNFHLFPWARKSIIAFDKKAGIIIFTFFRAGWKLTKKKGSAPHCISSFIKSKCVFQGAQQELVFKGI